MLVDSTGFSFLHNACVLSLFPTTSRGCVLTVISYLASFVLDNYSKISAPISEEASIASPTQNKTSDIPQYYTVQNAQKGFDRAHAPHIARRTRLWLIARAPGHFLGGIHDRCLDRAESRKSIASLFRLLRGIFESLVISRS